MDYAQQQRDPTKHAIGVGFVILMHVLIIYALMTGLGRAIVEVVKKPLTATIIEELKLPPPPPPPPKKIVEQRVQPVQTFVPPPDIPVPTISDAPTITATTTAPPVEAHVIAPPAPPPPAPKPAVRRGVTRLSGDYPEMPKAALRDGVSGVVVAHLYIDEKGNVTDVVIVRSSEPRYFDKIVIAAMRSWKFSAEGDKYIGEVEVNFKVN